MTQVSQALYGERNKGHALLSCTAGSEAVADAIRPYTDRAGDRPPDIELPSYVTGLRVGGHYAVMRTARDPSASRPGMVLTHAVYLPVAAAQALDDIGALLATLPDPPAREANLGPILPAPGTAPPAPPQAAIEAVLGAFLAGAPVVAWLGVDGFVDAVRAVWRVLAPRERGSFAFGFAFGPKGAPNPSGLSHALVRTPRALRRRWDGHSLVDPAVNADAATRPAVAAILERPGGESIRRFREAARVDVLSLQDYRTLEIAAPLYRSFEENDVTTSDLRTLAHALAHLAPSQTQAADLKRRVLSALIASADKAADVLGLRNLDLDPYPGADGFWTRVAEVWAGAAAGARDGHEADARLIAQALTASAPWASAILSAAIRVAQRSPTIAWGWWSAEPALVGALLSRLRPDAEFEGRLVEAAPDPVPSATTVQEVARERRLLLLHAHALLTQVGPAQALSEHLQVDPELAHSGALRYLAGAAGPAAIVHAAVDAHPAPSPLLALTTTVAPEVLGELDAASPGWRAVWAERVRSGLDVWGGVLDPDSARDAMLEVLIGTSADRDLQTLVIAASTTPLADLSNYSRRAEVWGRLPQQAQAGFLKATAEGWSLQAETGNVDWDVETELARVVFDPAQNPRLFDPANRGAILLAIEAFGNIDSLSEGEFVHWLHGLGRDIKLSTSEALTLGSVINKRGWRTAAGRVLSLAEWSRRDLLPAVSQIVDLLGWGDRAFAKLMGKGPTEDAWWEMLGHMAQHLLPTPDDLEPIWQRAGGALGDLKTSGTGGQRANHAVSLIRQGRGPSPTAFVRELRNLFSNNIRLETVEHIGYKLGVLKRNR